MFSSAKRAHAIHPPVPQILSQLRVEMETCQCQKMRWRRSQMLKWAQSRCEVAQREPVRRGRIVQTRSTWKTCLNTVGEMQEYEVFKWHRRYKKVIHGDSHQHENVPQSQERQSPAKNSDIRVRRCNACIEALREHSMHTNAEVDDQQYGFKVSYTSESCDTLSTSVHDWLERGVWTEPPTDLTQIE